MKRILSATIVMVFCTILGLGASGVAVAGGSSDTSGEGYHCYLFFSLKRGEFAQCMVNGEDTDEVLEKSWECHDKYVDEEGGVLDAIIGNVPKSICATRLTDTCAVDCINERAEYVNGCIDRGADPEKCEAKAETIYSRCVDDCLGDQCSGGNRCNSRKERCCAGKCIPIKQPCKIIKKPLGE